MNFVSFETFLISPLSASGSFHQTSIIGRLCCLILAFSLVLVRVRVFLAGHVTSRKTWVAGPIPTLTTLTGDVVKAVLEVPIQAHVWTLFLHRVSVVLITGDHLYIETLTGLIGNKAILISPQFQQAYSTCQLKFSYHMYGTTIGSLTVYLNDGVSRTRMWRLRGLYT